MLKMGWTNRGRWEPVDCGSRSNRRDLEFIGIESPGHSIALTAVAPCFRKRTRAGRGAYRNREYGGARRHVHMGVSSLVMLPLGQRF